ncbi:MAG: hypothetical protein IPL39_15645 [Opitutaceae bacterium]|nr:hypothetical protein [Opitutaceae bacterium]
MPTDAQFEERMPVWEAFSEFFLDTELQAEDHERIAQVLAASGYSAKELEEILVYEVYPTCKVNMFSMAGEWAGINPDWIREKMAPKYDRRPPIRIWSFHHRWMYGRHWQRVQPRIAELRAK